MIEKTALRESLFQHLDGLVVAQLPLPYKTVGF